MAMTREERLSRRRERAKSPEGRERNRLYLEKNRAQRNEWARKRAYLKTYGLTEQEVQKMIDDRNNCCDICDEKPEGKGHCGRLHIDHCHETGRIRGLLCAKCNMAIGLMQDDPDRLVAAASYLRTR